MGVKHQDRQLSSACIWVVMLVAPLSGHFQHKTVQNNNNNALDLLRLGSIIHSLNIHTLALWRTDGNIAANLRQWPLHHRTWTQQLKDSIQVGIELLTLLFVGHPLYPRSHSHPKMAGPICLCPLISLCDSERKWRCNNFNQHFSN